MARSAGPRASAIGPKPPVDRDDPGSEFFDLLPPLIGDDSPEVARQAIRAAQRLVRENFAPDLILALGRPELAEEAADAIARLGNTVVPTIADALKTEEVSVEVRRELPSVLLRIGTAEAEQTLVASLLEADGTIRHRIIASSTSCAPSVPTSASTRPLSNCCWPRRSPGTTVRIRCSGRCAES